MSRGRLSVRQAHVMLRPYGSRILVAWRLRSRVCLVHALAHLLLHCGQEDPDPAQIPQEREAVIVRRRKEDGHGL